MKEAVSAKDNERAIRANLAKEMKDHPEKFFVNPEGHPRDRLKIHENSDIPREGMFIGLNGVQYLIKPDMEVDLPRPLRIACLDETIETKTFQDGAGKPYTKNIPRVTYTLIKEGVS